MNRLKKRTCQFLVLVTTAGLLTGCGGGTPKLEDALKKTAAYEQKTVTSPASDTLGGEWTVIALARSGETVDENYFENIVPILKNGSKTRKACSVITVIRSIPGQSWH